MLEAFDVRPRDPLVPISALSGGNQQKAVLGRELYHWADFLLVGHPTRGVDIGAIDFIHSEFVRLREAGVAIVLISSELDELLALSDRLIVLYEGRIQGEAKRGEFSEKTLGLWMTGGQA